MVCDTKYPGKARVKFALVKIVRPLYAVLFENLTYVYSVFDVRFASAPADYFVSSLLNFTFIIHNWTSWILLVHPLDDFVKRLLGKRTHRNLRRFSL